MTFNNTAPIHPGWKTSRGAAANTAAPRAKALFGKPAFTPRRALFTISETPVCPGGGKKTILNPSIPKIHRVNPESGGGAIQNGIPTGVTPIYDLEKDGVVFHVWQTGKQTQNRATPQSDLPCHTLLFVLP